MSNITLSFIAFVNIFMIPVIAGHMYAYRHGIKWENSSEIRFICLLFCVLNLPVARALAIIVEKVFLVECTVATIKYTILGLCSIFLLLFFVEIYERFICIHVSISLRHSECKKKHKIKKEHTMEKEITNEK